MRMTRSIRTQNEVPARRTGKGNCGQMFARQRKRNSSSNFFMFMHSCYVSLCLRKRKDRTQVPYVKIGKDTQCGTCDEATFLQFSFLLTGFFTSFPSFSFFFFSSFFFSSPFPC